MRRALVLALAAGVMAGPACLPRKREPYRREHLYTAPRIRPQRSARADGSRRTTVLRMPTRTADVVIEEDEFTRVTEVTVSDRMPPHAILVTLMTQIPDADSHGGAILFSRMSGRWQYLRCHRVDMLVDGDPVPLTREEHDGRVGRYGVSEHVSVRIGGETLRAMLNATEVRARICNDDWTFTPAIMAGFAQVRDLVFPEPTDSGQPPDEPGAERD